MTDALIIPVDSSQVEKGKRSLADLAAQGKKTEQSIGGLGKAGSSTSASISGIATSAKTAALGVAAVVTGVSALTVTLLKTQIGIDKLNNTLKFSTGSAANAAKEIEYLRTTTNALGLEFATTATAYAKFSAASKGTVLEGQKTRDIFESIAKASTVLGLSADETGGALKAIEQIISKGTVSAEELRGQLGERLPGAFQIAARAMGVTTQELGKMLEQGELVSDVFLPKFAAELTKTLGDSPNSAAGSAQAQLNRLSNAWLDFKKAIAETGVITVVVKGVEAATSSINALKFTLFGDAKKGSVVDRASGFFNPIGETILNAFGIDSVNQKNTKKAKAASVNSGIRFGGNISSQSFAPSFGVTTKDGQGGYDARINNKQQLEDAKRKQQQSIRDADQLAKHKLDLEQRVYDAERLIDRDLYKIEIQHQKDVAKYKEKLEQEEYERKEKILDVLQKQANENFKEAQKAAEDIAKEAERISDSIYSAISDSIVRGLENGKGSFKTFLNSLANTAKATVIRLGVDFVLQSSGLKGILGSLSGLFSGSASGDSGGGNSILGKLSSIGDIFKSGNASIVSGIESLGTFLSTGSGGLGDTIGGALGQYAGAISKVLPFAGAALSLLKGDIKGAIGSGIGAALSFTPLGPIGGIIGSLLGGGLFGNKKIKRFGTTVSGTYDGAEYKDSYRGKFYDRDIGAGDALSSLNKTFADSFAYFLKGFDLNSVFSISSSQYQRGKSKKAGGFFSGEIDGKSFGGSVVGKKLSPEAVFGMLTEKLLGQGLADAIRASSASEGVKKFFAELTKKEDVAEVINTLVGLNKQLADLPPVFNAIRNAIDTTDYQLTIDELKKQFSDTTVFTNLFYTAEEQFATFTKQLTRQLTELDSPLVSTREQFRALVEGINVVDEATNKQFGGLVALAPQMDAYFKQLEAQKAQVDALTNSLRDINSFTSLAEYRNYRGVAANYGTNFALDYSANARSGAISVDSNGQASAGGESNLVELLTEIRDYAKQTLIKTSDSTSLLETFDRRGMPARA